MKLGKVGRRNFELPIDAVTEVFGILGRRGSGKTTTARVMAEGMLEAGQQIVAIDPIGVWWGLRSSADGEGEGFEVVILGGDHADAPLEEGSGNIVADLVIDDGLSLVLDLSLFRKGAQRRFLTDFAERVYHRSRHPLHLFMDEADLYAPQRPAKGAERLLGAIEDMVRRGRVRGLGMSLISQRPAVINKDVLLQLSTLVAMRTSGPHDVKALDEWVKLHSEAGQRKMFLDSIASLSTGTAWFWSPEWLEVFEEVSVKMPETFDSSATPKAGERVHEPRARSEVDLDALRTRMADAMERAEANDPKVLQKRIRELERELDAQEPEVEHVEVPVLEPELVSEIVEAVGDYRSSIEDLGSQLKQFADGVVDRMEQSSGAVEKAIEAVVEQISSVGAFDDLVAYHDRQIAKARPIGPMTGGTARSRSTPAPSPEGAEPDVKLKAGARRMLKALARPPGVVLTKAQIGTLAGLTPSSGTFSTYWSTLTRSGMIIERADGWKLTEAGLDAIDGEVPSAPRSTEEVVELWKSNLKAGARRMLDALVAAHPASLSREELGSMTDLEPSSGTFSTYLSTLRRNRLAEVDGETVTAGEALFL